MPDSVARLVLDDNEAILTSLSELRLFLDVPREALQQLVAMTRMMAFDEGAILIEEGQTNEDLFVLFSGRVGIFAGSERIVGLERRGDLLGEMSVISARPASATIIAETAVEVLSIQVGAIKRASTGVSSALQIAINRMIAVILAEKLAVTNEKAKQFEFANRRLAAAQAELREANETLEAKVRQRTVDLQKKTSELETQNAALLASRNRLEELHDAQAGLLKQISSLKSADLPALYQALKDLPSAAIGDSAPTVAAALREIQRIDTQLTPFTVAQTLEERMKDRSVLLAEPDAKQQMVSKMALGGSGVNLTIVAELAAGYRQLSECKFDIVCVTPEMSELAQFARRQHGDDVRTVLMTSARPREYIAQLRESPFLSNIVSRGENDRLFTVKNIITTIRKLISQDLFGLEKYLGWGTDIRVLDVCGSEERRQLIGEMSAYFKSIGLFGHVVGRCERVAEELLMNAIYDAPHSPDGKALYNHLPRTTAVELGPTERAQFHFGCDGILAGVGVSDPFGALDRDIILNYLDSCYRGEVSPLHEEKGGGGLGVFQIVESSDLVVFNVRKGVRTEVLGLFNIKAVTEENIRRKSFHYFSDA